MAPDRNNMKDVSVIVLAAGSGSRFGGPKQFLELKPGVRLVDASLETAFSVTDNVILVLPDGHEWNGRRVSTVVRGGDSRLDSVAAGLTAIPGNPEIVVVHDAAHPLATRQSFFDVIAAVRHGADSAVPFLPVADVVKRIDSHGELSTVGRDGLGLAQVPMAFDAKTLRAAHLDLETRPSHAWEDAMLIEFVGGSVVGVDGSSRNIHVVTDEDLELAKALIAPG